MKKEELTDLELLEKLETIGDEHDLELDDIFEDYTVEEYLEHFNKVFNSEEMQKELDDYIDNIKEQYKFLKQYEGKGYHMVVYHYKYMFTISVMVILDENYNYVADMTM